MVFYSLSLYGKNQQPWIESQLHLISQLEDNNLSNKEITKLLETREELYTHALETILLNKNYFLNYPPSYEKKIFSLTKIMDINKKRANKYAFLRDQVQVNFYRLLALQNKMIQSILHTLDVSSNRKEFETKMYLIFANTQKSMDELERQDYHPYLKLKNNNKILQDLQHNIKEYYGLREIIFDLFRYFVTSKNQIYRLNKYEKYNILRPVLAIEANPFIQKLNNKLIPHHLDMIKIFLFILIAFIIYTFRHILLHLLKFFLLNHRFFKKHTAKIMEDITPSIIVLSLLIGLELIFYIYNDFNSSETSRSFFNILYTFFITKLIYKSINSSAHIQIEKINYSKKKVKNELFNITVKVINFLIILIGFLFILYFAGVNLTTVLSGLGIGGFAVALAARESLSAFFGTISILMSDMFSQGDTIEINNEIGTVVEIGLRATTIRTGENALIVIPNTSLANNEVKNWSKRVMGRRIKMVLTLTYHSHPTDIKNAIQDIKEMLKAHTGIATDNIDYNKYSQKGIKLVSKNDELGIKNILCVNLDNFSDSSIDILVYCFTKTTSWDQWLAIKEDVMYKIMDILEKNNLEFAFPTISIEKKKD